jgi:hypothetical protein
VSWGEGPEVQDQFLKESEHGLFLEEEIAIAMPPPLSCREN